MGASPVSHRGAIKENDMARLHKPDILSKTPEQIERERRFCAWNSSTANAQKRALILDIAEHVADKIRPFAQKHRPKSFITVNISGATKDQSTLSGGKSVGCGGFALTPKMTDEQIFLSVERIMPRQFKNCVFVVTGDMFCDEQADLTKKFGA